MSYGDKTELLHLILICSRCRRKETVQQQELWRRKVDPNLEFYKAVPRKLFEPGRVPGSPPADSMLYRFAVNDSEDVFLCGSCYEKYMGLRKRLLEAVNKRMLDFLEDKV